MTSLIRQLRSFESLPKENYYTIFSVITVLSKSGVGSNQRLGRKSNQTLGCSEALRKVWPHLMKWGLISKIAAYDFFQV